MITLRTAEQRAKETQEQSKKPDQSREQIKLLNAYYRAAHDYMTRHLPPRADEDYWLSAADDLGKTSAMYGNNEFLMDLLAAVFNELRRIAADDEMRGEKRA